MSRPSPRRTLATCCTAHVVHDGFSDVTYVLLPLLAQTFGLSLAQVGMIRSAHRVAMASFQLPAGLIAERFGERNLLAIGTLIAGVVVHRARLCPRLLGHTRRAVLRGRRLGGPAPALLHHHFARVSRRGPAHRARHVQLLRRRRQVRLRRHRQPVPAGRHLVAGAGGRVRRRGRRGGRDGVPDRDEQPRTRARSRPREESRKSRAGAYATSRRSPRCARSTRSTA